jgi:hypothetical protein
LLVAAVVLFTAPIMPMVVMVVLVEVVVED